MKDFHDEIEEIKVGSLTLSANVLDLFADAAKALATVAHHKAADIYTKLIDRD